MLIAESNIDWPAFLFIAGIMLFCLIRGMFCKE